MLTFASQLNNVITEVANLREKIVGLEQDVREKNSIIERLQSAIVHVHESIDKNTVKIAYLESESAQRTPQVILSYNGTQLWKIESYQRKRQDAINEVKTALYSPPFYSAQFGYKMCAKIYMNGDGFGKGSHLSLFFVVMRGEMITYEEFCCAYLFDKFFDPLASRAVTML